MTHGPHHPPTAWPWPSPRGCRRGATDGAHHSHRHGGATNPDGSLGPARPRPGTAASATPSSRTDASTRPRTPIPGFLLKRGRYTKFDAPDAVVQTVPFGINNRGVIVGKFTTADGVDHGFRRDARGRFTTIDVPGAAATQLTKINDRGQIVGYTAAPTATDPFLAGARGFLLARAPGDPSPRSTSPARPEPSPTASTTPARSSASTRTPTPRRARARAVRRRWAA
jgi:YD repeat-containing protein